MQVLLLNIKVLNCDCDHIEFMMYMRCYTAALQFEILIIL